MRRQRAPDFDSLLGPGGAIEDAIPLYERRPGQVEMAKAVWRVFSNGGFILAEAGTGTGKSLAYLLPSLLLDKRVVVSTGTKALQEQLARKDLPLCAKALKREVKAVTVKGRANYLCLHYWSRFLAEPLLNQRSEARYLAAIAKWAEKTKIGDRAELKGVPDDLSFWHDISARGERCLGTRCPLYKECFITRLKREAEAAEIIVTNHHLLFADKAVKSRSADARVLPDYTHLVLDEAHDAEGAATSFFGTTATRRMIAELLRDAAKAAPKEKFSLAEAISEAERSVALYFEAWESGGEKKITVDASTLPRGEGELRSRMLSLLDVVGTRLEAAGATTEEAFGLLERLDEWRDSLLFVLEESGPDYVRIAEVRSKNVLLSANPIDIAPVMKEHLWNTLNAALLTSATLCTAGSFSFLRGQLGLDCNAEELRVPSPFDYPSQGLFYVPERFPQPSSPEFPEALCQEALSLVQASRGRAFLLCTSYKNMRTLAQFLETTIPYPLLVQGEEPKGLLLEHFRESGEAVLVATTSFWQGVDVQGEALSLVVLDKLPFGSPQDPLTQARIERLKKAGRDPFTEYQLPSAAILLQQGAGRLIRSKQDRGVVACLDVRLRQKGYGRHLMASLPDFQTAGDIAAVRAFFAQSERNLSSDD